MAGEANLPPLAWWRLVTSILGIATAVLAVLGALSTLVIAANSSGASVVAQVNSPARWLLLAAGMLAIERSEHTYSRLIRGLVSPARLLSEKVLLS